jgi:hypothetical protein
MSEFNEDIAVAVLKFGLNLNNLYEHVQTLSERIDALEERAPNAAELAATDSQHTQERHCFNCANYQGDLGCGIGACSNLAAWVHNGVRA